MMPRGLRKGGVLEGSLETQHFEWQDHCFAAGPEDNLRTLQGFSGDLRTQSGVCTRRVP